MLRLNRRDAIVGALAAGAAVTLSTRAMAADHRVEMLNSSPSGSMVFEPALTRVAVGDTVTFVPVDKGHNAESIRGMAPEGAEPFKGAINEELTVTFSVPGVYGVKCSPHYAMGMVALIVVGDDLSNLEEAKEARNPGKAQDHFEALYAELEG